VENEYALREGFTRSLLWRWSRSGRKLTPLSLGRSEISPEALIAFTEPRSGTFSGVLFHDIHTATTPRLPSHAHAIAAPFHILLQASCFSWKAFNAGRAMLHRRQGSSPHHTSNYSLALYWSVRKPGNGDKDKAWRRSSKTHMDLPRVPNRKILRKDLSRPAAIIPVRTTM
jgi:hypothetical protein